MQIWKFHYMVGTIQKQYPENFAFFNLRILELFTREVYIFLKKKATISNIVLSLYFCKQAFHKSQVRMSQKLNSVIMRNLRHIIFM